MCSLIPEGTDKALKFPIIVQEIDQAPEISPAIPVRIPKWASWEAPSNDEEAGCPPWALFPSTGETIDPEGPLSVLLCGPG